MRHRGSIWANAWIDPHLPINTLLNSRLNGKMVKPKQAGKEGPYAAEPGQARRT